LSTFTHIQTAAAAVAVSTACLDHLAIYTATGAPIFGLDKGGIVLLLHIVMKPRSVKVIEPAKLEQVMRIMECHRKHGSNASWNHRALCNRTYHMCIGADDGCEEQKDEGKGLLHVFDGGRPFRVMF